MPSHGSVVLVLLAGSTLALACGSSRHAGSGTASAGTGAGATASAGSGRPTTGGTGGATSTTSTGSAGTGGSAPSCGTDGWLTYNHDAARTGASGGCVNGPLTTQWRYVPVPPAPRTFKNVFNSVAQSDGVFLAWSASDGMYLGTTAADRVDLTGARVWTFDSGTDSNLGTWPTLALGALILNNDGIYYLDPTSGTKTAGNGVDNWGQTLTDGTSLYTVNDGHVDGPDIDISAYDATCKQLWASNTYGMCRIDSGDIAGGIALDGGTLFYAPSYSLGMGVSTGFASGLYAFDPATGKQQWFQAATPTSAISVGNGLVYLIEGGDQLVARKESDGTQAWTATATGAGTQSPVLAGGLVIVATPQAVSAFDATTGKAGWTAPVTGAQAQAADLMFSGGCVSGSGQWTGNDFGTTVPTTTLAAALGSGTLVVTAPDAIHVLSLATGVEAWKGVPAQAMGSVFNPSIVGKAVYVIDDGGLVALQGM